MTIRAFVAGFPVRHSKSPKLHGYWLQHHSVEGSYEALELSPENFPRFLETLSETPSPDTFVGGNVTIPHKEAAFQLVDERDEAAEMIGAVNTVWLRDGKLHGSNTDAFGFSGNLDDFAPAWRKGETAAILGAGGASRAVIHAVLEAGYKQVHIANRTLSRARSLSDRFGGRCQAHGWDAISELLAEADLLVNTTSIGMAGKPDTSRLALPSLDKVRKSAIVSDIVYTPLETPFLKEAIRCGLQTVDGLGMLLHQAAPGFEIWFGIKPRVTTGLRQHILEADK